MSSIPRLQLFSLYPAAPTTVGNALNANSSFDIPATNLSDGYSVNGAPPNSELTALANDLSIYFGANQNGGLTTSNSVQNFNTPLQFNFNSSTSPVQQASVSNDVDLGPDLPSSWQRQIDNYAITDQNMAALLAQPSFEIPYEGLGVLVTTNGSGGVQSVQIDPSYVGVTDAPGVSSPNFDLPNLEEISEGAVYKVDNQGIGPDYFPVGSPENPTPAQNPAQNNNPLQNNNPASNPLVNPNPAQGGLSPGARVNGVFQLSAVKTVDLQSQGLASSSPIGGATNTVLGKSAVTAAGQVPSAPVLANANNPIQARLFQLQPPNQGLTVSGTQADASANVAKQIAANRANYQVNLDVNTNAQLQNMLQQNVLQSQVYSASSLTQAVDGNLPVIPSAPAEMQTASNTTPNFYNALDQISQVVSTVNVGDAASKRGSDGYLPQMFQGGGNNAGTGTGGGSTGGGMSSGGNLLGGGFSSGMGSAMGSGMGSNMGQSGQSSMGGGQSGGFGFSQQNRPRRQLALTA